MVRKTERDLLCALCDSLVEFSVTWLPDGGGGGDGTGRMLLEDRVLVQQLSVATLTVSSGLDARSRKPRLSQH